MSFFVSQQGLTPTTESRISRLTARVCRFLALGAFLLVAGFGGRTFASQDIELSWDPDTSGTVSYYRVFYGTHSGVYTNSFLTAGALNDIIINWLPGGATYYFALQAYDVDGHSSPLSNEASWTLAPVLPIILQPRTIYDANGVPAYLQLSASVSPADSWELDYSTDMVHWSPYDFGNSDSIFEYVDMTQASQMFFRVQRLQN